MLIEYMAGKIRRSTIELKAVSPLMLLSIITLKIYYRIERYVRKIDIEYARKLMKIYYRIERALRYYVKYRIPNL